jgi:hypothetical protein
MAAPLFGARAHHARSCRHPSRCSQPPVSCVSEAIILLRSKYLGNYIVYSELILKRKGGTMSFRIRSALAPAVLVVFLGLALPVGAFSPRGQLFRHCIRGGTISVAAAAENEDTVIYSDEWEDGVPPPPKAAKKNKNRWNALSPSVKAKIVKEAQQRAIRNKKKNESSNDKKRRKLTPSRPQ